MAKLVNLIETEDEITTRKAINIITKAVRQCNFAIDQLKDLAKNSGGKAGFLSKVGDKSSDIVAAYTSLKTLVEDISDLNVTPF